LRAPWAKIAFRLLTALRRTPRGGRIRKDRQQGESAFAVDVNRRRVDGAVRLCRRSSATSYPDHNACSPYRPSGRCRFSFLMKKDASRFISGRGVSTTRGLRQSDIAGKRVAAIHYMGSVSLHESLAANAPSSPPSNGLICCRRPSPRRRQARIRANVICPASSVRARRWYGKGRSPSTWTLGYHR